MKNVKEHTLFKKEAYLFDARLYVMKSFLAVLSAYLIVQHLPLVHKDIISVLFGLMMTLEPVTVTGIRSGMKQITATILGAIVTAIIITILGINLWSVAVSVSATLIVCLKINWREVSPVAIFTSIYMTNYVQYTINGEPSPLLTFELRILALGIGVLFAVIFNFIFSVFFYKQMEHKRIIHSLVSLSDHMKQLQIAVEDSSLQKVVQVKESLPDTFNMIDWLSSLLKDKDKETIIKKKMNLAYNSNKFDSYRKALTALRNIAHLLYDTSFYLTMHMNTIPKTELQVIAEELEKCIEDCDYLITHFGDVYIESTSQVNLGQMNGNSRILENLSGIKEMLDVMKASRKAVV